MQERVLTTENTEITEGFKLAKFPGSTCALPTEDQIRVTGASQ